MEGGGWKGGKIWAMKIRIGWLSAILFVCGLVFGVLAIRDINKATIVVEWETASELDTVGYNILRGEADSGPFIKINDQLIQPASDPITGGSYTFEDSNAIPGKKYFYYLEEIEINGATNRHGPIVQKASYGNVINSIFGGLMVLGAIGLAWRIRRQNWYNCCDETPNSDHATISREKLTGYLLSQIHPVGQSKARFFRALGFNLVNVDLFEQNLLKIARSNEVEEEKSSEYGVKFVIDGLLKTPNDEEVFIRMVWIIEFDQEIPRFITAYPV